MTQRLHLATLVGLLVALGAAADFVPPVPTTSHGNTLLQGQYVLLGGRLASADGRTELELSDEGTLQVLHSGKVVWTQGGADWERFAVDIKLGCLVLQKSKSDLQFLDGFKRPHHQALPNVLVVQNDGDVVIYDSRGAKRWSTHTQIPGYEPKPGSDGDTLPLGWKVPKEYVQAVEQFQAPTASRCPVTSVFIPGLDGQEPPASSLHICPPCQYITSIDLRVTCTLQGVTCFTCSGGGRVTLRTDATGDPVTVSYPSGFSAAVAGGIPGIPGLAHVSFVPYTPRDPSVFPPPPPAKDQCVPPAYIQVADPRRIRPSTGQPACPPHKLLGNVTIQGVRSTADSPDLHRITCGPNTKIVGLRSEGLEFSVVCGVTSPGVVLPTGNPCTLKFGHKAWYSTVTKRCYIDKCKSPSVLYVCGEEPGKQFCLVNVGIVSSTPYALFNANNKLIGFTPFLPYPCDVSGLCSYTRQCYSASHGVIRSFDFFPPDPPPFDPPAFAPPATPFDSFNADYYRQFAIGTLAASRFISPPPPVTQPGPPPPNSSSPPSYTPPPGQPPIYTAPPPPSYNPPPPSYTPPPPSYTPPPPSYTPPQSP